MPKFFDVHTHVQFAAYAKDADEVIQRAFDAGVWIINVGTEKRTSEAGIALAEKYPEGVYATIGLHPNHAAASFHDTQELKEDDIPLGEDFDYDYYKKLAIHPKVVGIGECGLDYYRSGIETKEKQFAILEKQISLSNEVKKPLMIHCRDAFRDLISVFQSSRFVLNNPGVIHFFSGTKEDARVLLDLGFSFSFGGVLTFTRDYDEVVKYIPLENIVLETDAPYITPVPYRGKRNEPAYVIEVAKKMAEIRRVSSEDISVQTVANTKRIFGV